MKQLLLIAVGALFLLLVTGWGQQATAITAPAAVDHYKCYKVKGKAFSPKPTPEVSDEFELDRDTVGKPFLICNPAIKDGSPVFFPDVHQVCYKVKGKKKLDTPLEVLVSNQFGDDQELKVKKKEKILCVPSRKICIGDAGEPVGCPNEAD